eukprot:11339484-Prorocentrum_lima.AAC.1
MAVVVLALHRMALSDMLDVGVVPSGSSPACEFSSGFTVAKWYQWLGHPLPQPLTDTSRWGCGPL